MGSMNKPKPVANLRPWYEISNAAEDVAEIYIYDQIGYDLWSGDGVVARDFMSDLAAVTAGEIHLHINSPGGSVFDGVAIYNGLVRHRAKVTTFIDGIAASIASVIALAGERVIMAENALFMIHNPFGAVQGDARDMRSMAEVLDKIRDTLVTTYEARTGLGAETLHALMDAETWFGSGDALEAGFIDEISAAQRIAASFDLADLPFRHAPDAGEVSAQTSSTGGALDNAGDSGGASETGKTETYIHGLGYVRF